MAIRSEEVGRPIPTHGTGVDIVVSSLLGAAGVMFIAAIISIFDSGKPASTEESLDFLSHLRL